MKLGKVVGTVVATQKDPKLAGNKLVIVADADLEGKARPTYLVAVDTVGAGTGEVVLTVSGSSARQTEQTRDCPVDGAVVAIVERVEREGTITYRKDPPA